MHDKKSFWCCFFLHFASELGISYFSLLTGCMKTEQNRTWRLSSQTWCALFLYKMYIEAEHCVQNNINTSSTKLVFNFFMFFYKTQVISRKVGENVFSIWLLMIDVGIGCKYLYKLIVHVWLNQKLISPPRKHNYCINVEEWGDRKSTSVNSHHRESLYLTWEFYGNTTIMLSNEPLQGQLNSLHTPGIVYRQLCLYMEEFRGAHTCVQLHKLNLHTCIIHLLILAVSTPRCCSECERTCALIQCTYIWALRTSCLLRCCK